MNTWTRPLTIMALLCTLATSSGCEAEELGSLLGIGDEPVPTPPPSTPRPRKATPPPPIQKPVIPASAMYLRANLAFDMVRSRGIAEVYEGKPKVALATFRVAQKMKPSDPTVQMWIDTITEAMNSKRKGAAQPSLPQMPAVDVGDAVAPNLPAPNAGPPAPSAPKAFPTLDPRLVF